MEWLLKHPILIFVIIMLVSSLLKHLKSSGGAQAPSDGDEGGDYERTRRLQEEIRRKIAERRGQSVPAPAPAMPAETPYSAPVSPWDEDEDDAPYKIEEPPPLHPMVRQSVEVDPVLEHQRRLVEQLAALQAQQAEVSRAARAASNPTPMAPSSAGQPADVYGLRELRNARSLRKAVILREVIGPPVALR